MEVTQIEYSYNLLWKMKNMGASNVEIKQTTSLLKELGFYYKVCILTSAILLLLDR